MKEGFWGNYETGIWFQIDEHERWLRRGSNAGKLGVPNNVIAEFSRYTDRETLLPFVYRNAPVMRWRCHGESVTFEFYTEDWQKPLEIIRKWCRLFAGDYLFLRMVNFNGMDVRETLWKDWDKTFNRRRKK